MSNWFSACFPLLFKASFSSPEASGPIVRVAVPVATDQLTQLCTRRLARHHRVRYTRAIDVCESVPPLYSLWYYMDHCDCTCSYYQALAIVCLRVCGYNLLIIGVKPHPFLPWLAEQTKQRFWSDGDRAGCCSYTFCISTFRTVARAFRPTASGTGWVRWLPLGACN